MCHRVIGISSSGSRSHLMSSSRRVGRAAASSDDAGSETTVGRINRPHSAPDRTAVGSRSTVAATTAAATTSLRPGVMTGSDNNNDSAPELVV